MESIYDQATPPAGQWSGERSFSGTPIGPVPPAIGTRVNVVINRLGHGTVVSYFMEAGFVGVAVLLESPPDWRRKQGAPDSRPALVFGAEIAQADGKGASPPALLTPKQRVLRTYPSAHAERAFGLWNVYPSSFGGLADHPIGQARTAALAWANAASHKGC